jgi:hypothetical protein
MRCCRSSGPEMHRAEHLPERGPARWPAEGITRIRFPSGLVHVHAGPPEDWGPSSGGARVGRALPGVRTTLGLQGEPGELACQVEAPRHRAIRRHRTARCGKPCQRPAGLPYRGGREARGTVSGGGVCTRTRVGARLDSEPNTENFDLALMMPGGVPTSRRQSRPHRRGHRRNRREQTMSTEHPTQEQVGVGILGLAAGTRSRAELRGEDATAGRRARAFHSRGPDLADPDLAAIYELSEHA